MDRWRSSQVGRFILCKFWEVNKNLDSQKDDRTILVFEDVLYILRLFFPGFA